MGRLGVAFKRATRVHNDELSRLPTQRLLRRANGQHKWFDGHWIDIDARRGCATQRQGEFCPLSVFWRLAISVRVDIATDTPQVVRDKVVRRPWTRLLDEKDELVRHEIETPNESVEKPQNQNFQKRNSLISIATIFEKCAKFDFFYSLNVAREPRRILASARRA